ncbi:DUF503 domain-containing protein [Granulicella sibirica]|uniref:YlxP-like protein n=1 Tax=Granulicella sibirica TaxID=2479048 RepID=A0A4Q0T6E5_9BACT|nr:DUF503 domain-containing protein [Granulicella sibirica]RXH57579.1 protein of unknown function DUF503 [Granulicella sibirica]
MPIAKLIIELEIPHAQSLKDRRQVVRSLKEKLGNKFNAGVAELDEALVWNRATLGIVAISNSTTYLKGQLEEIDRTVARLVIDLGAQVSDSYAEILDE